MEINDLVGFVCKYLKAHPEDVEVRERLSDALTPPKAGQSTDNDEELPPPVQYTTKDVQDAFDSKQYETVVRLTTELSVTRPNSAILLKFKGRALYNLKRFREARDALSSAQSLDYSSDIEETLRACQKQLQAQMMDARSTDQRNKSEDKKNTSCTTPEELLQQLCTPDILRKAQEIANNPETMNAFRQNPIFESLFK